MGRRIAILGCGPAGLLAAHAAVQLGHQPTVYSVKKKSLMPGAMFVHEHIDGITDEAPDGHISVLQEGTRQGYAEKVYGNPEAQVSWDTFQPQDYPAWSMAAAYDKLWDMYGEAVVNRPIEQEFLHRLTHPKRVGPFAYDMVISSVPAKVLCHNPYHFFNGQQVWITENAWRECPDDTIIYNGEPNIPWYRTSLIFGHGATESTEQHHGAFSGVKPLTTNCDCHPEIKRVGRFGRWEKGVLVHHAYRQAMEEMAWAYAA